MNDIDEKKQLQTRIRRWHGSKMRSDRFTFVDLMDSQFSWFYPVVKSRIPNPPDGFDFIDAIDHATIDDLRRLWRRIETDRINKKFKL